MPVGTCLAILLHGQIQKGDNVNISIGQLFGMSGGGWETERLLFDPYGEQL